MTNGTVARVLGGIALLALVTFIAFFAPFSVLGNANLALTYALVAISLVILTGWVGQISLAQASFVGIGAFVTGAVVRAWGVPFPLTLPIGAGVAAGSAALLGIVALRVRGLYLAVATLIFAWMAQSYLFNQPWLAGAGGSSAAEVEPLGEAGTIPYIDFTDRRTFYFLLLATTVGVVLSVANLRDSKTGRAWFAVKGSEVAAASLGIAVTRYKLVAFAVSGCVAGIAGSLVFTHEQVVTSTAFAVDVSLFYLAVAVVGGLTSLGGAVASGILFALLEELFFRFQALAGALQIVSAVLLAAVLLFFPAGLAGIPGRVAAAVGSAWSSERGRAARQAGRRAVRVVLDGVRRRRSGDAVAPGTDADPVSGASPEPDGERMGERAEEAVVAHEVEVSDTDAQALRLPWWLGFLQGPLDRLAGRRAEPPIETPDALASSMARAVEEQEAVEEQREEEPDLPGLVYVPGTAGKPRLPARKRRSPVLAARDVTVQFGGLTAVDDYTLEVREGEIVGLIGPNGAGKTTLFNAISGLNSPTTGAVELFGRDVTHLDVHERARLGMGRTFQAIQLFAQLSVFDNLMVATHHRNPSGFFSHLAATKGAVVRETEARERVRQVIGLIGLEDVADRSVAGLPFGVLRLVEMARALVTGSPFVMLDEPASGLDNAETDRFMDLLLWVRETLSVSLLLIEHDVRVVTGLSDHIYVIDRGKKIADGSPKAVQRNPKVIAAYLGQAPGETDDERGASRSSSDGARREPVRSGR